MRITLKRIDGVYIVTVQNTVHTFSELEDAIKFIYNLRGGNKNGTEH